ncbi:MAG: hypothetical protein ACLTGI_06585 [Hoylesella buccalis]
MNKVRLIFKSVTEIVGSDDVGLLILVDEQQQRQLTIRVTATCCISLVFVYKRFQSRA